jgi:hypothetical protein
MNEQDFNKWCIEVKKVFYSQIILDRLKTHKKINKNQYKKIKIKIKKMRYKTHLNSPCFEYKENLRRRVALTCIKDYRSFMGI